jgi:ABC transport system ATP-binding/permease protein
MSNLMTWKYQEKILTERLLDCWLGNFKTTVLLILQAPAIAVLIAWRFHAVTPNDFFYFSLSLSSLWFGCTNAAREIVDEQAVFFRERLGGLKIPAYMVSKVKVLSLLGLIQSLLLILPVNYFVPISGFLPLHVLTAFLTTVAGVALGLFISSVVRTVHQADALVPLVLIPQILFSPLVMPENSLSGWAVYFERIMILHWSFKAFQELAGSDISLVEIGYCFGSLLLMIIFLTLLAGVVLKNRKIIY